MKEKTLFGAFSKAVKMVASLEETNGEQVIATASKIISDMVKEETTVEASEAAEKAFVDAYYNKYKNGDKLYGTDNHPEGADKFVDDNTFYMVVANHQPSDITSVVIGDVEYKDKGSNDYKDPENRYKYLSIGMNAFAYVNVWKIQDGKLMVAIPWLYSGADAATGICKVVAGGIEYSVVLFAPVVEGKALMIKSVAMSKNGTHTAEATVSGTQINVKYGNASQALCLVIGDEESDIVDKTIPHFNFYPTGCMSITCPETFGGMDCSHVQYLIPYKNAPIEEAYSTNVYSRLIFPGKGDIRYSVHAELVVDEIA